MILSSSLSLFAVGANFIAKGIRRNRFLLFIGLQWNRIDDAGAKALGRALTRNTALKGMFLMGNPISKTGAQILVEGSTTVTLHMGGTVFTYLFFDFREPDFR